jgi:hypothetical protein
MLINDSANTQDKKGSEKNLNVYDFLDILKSVEFHYKI